MKKRYISISMCALLLPYSMPASAGTMSAKAPYKPFVASLSIAPSWHTSGQSQTKTLQNDITKHYADLSSHNTIAQGEFFLGRELAINDSFRSQLGAAIALASDARLKGDIWEDADPDFNNYRYHYKVNHAHLAFKGKILADVNSSLNITPYVAGSAGIGFNRARNFIIAPKIFEEIASPAFAAKTITTFTYTLEAGAQKTISTHFNFGIGYVFSDWGKNRLDRAPNQTIGTGLQANHLYTNGVQFSLNYHA